jgi:hypothetical protein
VLLEPVVRIGLVVDGGDLAVAAQVPKDGLEHALRVIDALSG